MAARPDQGDDVQGLVQLPSAVPAEPMTHNAPGGGLQGSHTSKPSEGRLAAAPTRMRPRNQPLSSGDSPNTRLIKQHRHERRDQLTQLALVLA
jgi:hypothetical protein